MGQVMRMRTKFFDSAALAIVFFFISINLYSLQIERVSRIPFIPRNGDELNVIAEINNQENLKILKMFYSINGSIYSTVPIDSNRNDLYYFHIPEIVKTGDRLSYYIYAENVSSNIVVSDTYRFTVGEKSILFDYTKEETAGNADWVIDDNMPYPFPENPTSETSWLGAISSWAFELHEAGYNVVTLPPGSTITYGDSSRPLDLVHFNVYVICEPQDPFSYDERKAIFDFVRNGGGLFLVSDHYGADRNNNGWDATEIFNAFGVGDSMGIHFNSDNESNNNITEDSYNYNNSNNSDTIFHGPFGDITGALCYHNGTTMRVWGNAIGKVWKSNYSQGSSDGVMMAQSTFHKGRVIGIGDSSPADDGTGDAGNNLYNGWSGEGQDRLFFLNGTYWLIANPYNGVEVKKDTVSSVLSLKALSDIIPSGGRLTLSVGNPDKKKLELNLYDISGNKVSSLYIGSGDGQVSFSIPHIHSGLYFIGCSGFTNPLKIAIIKR